MSVRQLVQPSDRAGEWDHKQTLICRAPSRNGANIKSMPALRETYIGNIFYFLSYFFILILVWPIR